MISFAGLVCSSTSRYGTMMRPSHLILLAVLTPLAGCGTFHNLKDSPNGPMFMGTGATYPMGGTVRSGMLAVMGPPVGLAGVAAGNKKLLQGDSTGFKDVKDGMRLTTAGLVAIADTPVSLVCDIVTLPVAYARFKQYPWATWWDDKSFNFLPDLKLSSEDAAKPVDEGDKAIDLSYSGNCG